MDFKINENTTSLIRYSQKGHKLTFLVKSGCKKLFQRSIGPTGVRFDNVYVNKTGHPGKLPKVKTIRLLDGQTANEDEIIQKEEKCGRCCLCIRCNLDQTL